MIARLAKNILLGQEPKPEMIARLAKNILLGQEPKPSDVERLERLFPKMEESAQLAIATAVGLHPTPVMVKFVLKFIKEGMEREMHLGSLNTEMSNGSNWRESPRALVDSRWIAWFCNFFYPGLFRANHALSFFKTAPKKGSYGYIASQREHMLFNISNVCPEFLEGDHFADVGSGIGDKVLMMALATKMDCTGIELGYSVEVYRDVIKRIIYGQDGVAEAVKEFIPGRVRIEHDDATHLGERTYKVLDRIYTYVPVHEEEEKKKFYNHIAQFLKPGTLWWERSPSDAWDKACEANGAKLMQSNKRPNYLRIYKF